MFERMELRREKKKEKKRLEKRKEKLCIRYELLLKAKKKYELDNTEYSKNKLESVEKSIKETLKSIYYADKDIGKLKKIKEDKKDDTRRNK